MLLSVPILDAASKWNHAVLALLCLPYSLSILSSRFIHDVTGSMTSSGCVHACFSGHSGCFLILALMNSAPFTLSLSYFCLLVLAHRPSAQCILSHLVNLFLFFTSLSSFRKLSPATPHLGLSVLHRIQCCGHPNITNTTILIAPYCNCGLLVHSALSSRMAEAMSDCSQLRPWCLAWCMAQRGQNKNGLAHSTE